MKAMVLHGSPRKNQNSDTLAKYFIDGLKENEDLEYKDFYLNELSIKPCQGCETCQTTTKNKCIIQDDMQEIYSAFFDADIIVFTTPMYWGYMTAQMKTVIDRMEAIAGETFQGKTFVVLITYRHHYQSTIAFFERIKPYFKFDLYSVVCCTMVDGKDISIFDCKEKLEETYELGKELSVKQ